MKTMEKPGKYSKPHVNRELGLQKSLQVVKCHETDEEVQKNLVKMTVCQKGGTQDSMQINAR